MGKKYIKIEVVTTTVSKRQEYSVVDERDFRTERGLVFDKTVWQQIKSMLFSWASKYFLKQGKDDKDDGQGN
ncbi:hypothetical protein [Agaribacter flavus]|uniref:Uncharacterized protein n=1 Tax=Agaribacter flavus TaxID=1902781 RepID=A0ABV7FSH7_9ALTE